MNNKIKFLEIVLSDLISERDTLEMDLNNILNNNVEKTNDKKKKFKEVLQEIVNVNNKIKTMTGYLTEYSVETNDKKVVQ
jgi:flagellar biosynthesis chaperone FliJ